MTSQELDKANARALNAVPSDEDMARWGAEIKEAIRSVLEKEEGEDVIEILEGAAAVARASLGGS